MTIDTELEQLKKEIIDLKAQLDKEKSERNFYKKEGEEALCTISSHLWWLKSRLGNAGVLEKDKEIKDRFLSIDSDLVQWQYLFYEE